VNEAGWKRWRAAEAALGNGAPLDKAAAELPPRQGAILRALDALERGDRASIKAAARATEDLDIGAVLDLVQAAPDDIDPTAVRAGLKRGGLTNTPLPKLDLLRRYAAALANDYATVPPALTKSSRDNLVLAATMMGLDRRSTAYRIGSHLVQRSQRLASLWAAATGIVRGHTGPLNEIAAAVDPLVAVKGAKLDPARWPTAQRLRGVTHASFEFLGLEPNTLERWLQAPLETSWDIGCERDFGDQRRGPRDERRRLLGRLLVAIERVLRNGRPHEAIPAADAANMLVGGLSGLPAQATLQAQLALLLTRLTWWASDTPPKGLATVVWCMPVPLTTEERRHLAGKLLPAIRPNTDEGAAVAEMLVLVYQDPHQVDVESLGLLLRHARSITAVRLHQGLHAAAPWHRKLVLATHATATGDTAAAFEHAVDAWLAPGAEVTKHLDRARVATATHVVRFALEGILQSDSRSLSGSERISATAARWFAAIEARQIEVDIELLGRGVELAARPRHVARPELEQARIALLVRQRLASPTVPGEEFSLERARIALAIADEATAESGFRALGRHLREAPKERALASALRWCAGLQRDSGGTPNRTLERWQSALDAWLLQQPMDLLGNTALALAKAEPECAEPLLDWVGVTIDPDDWVPSLDSFEEYVGMHHSLRSEFEDMLSDEPGMQEAFEKLAEMALKGPPTRPLPQQHGRTQGREVPGRRVPGSRMQGRNVEGRGGDRG